MTDDAEFFGDTRRMALARRSADLWKLLRDNPRFSYYGRPVALSDPREDTATILSAMARLQGAAVSNFFPSENAEELFAELAGQGMATDRHEHFLGGEEALRASLKALESHRLPNDLDIVAIDADTSRDLVARVARLCQSCDVNPIPGAVMRGKERPGICLAALDKAGEPVATGASFMSHHPSSPHATDAFWGMLATRPDRRGERIALLLGARAIVHMWNSHGARGFMTGVRAGNASSRSLCEKLGVMPTRWIYAWCMDPEVFGASPVTK